VISAILRNRIAVVGVPAGLFGCALVVGVLSGLTGFSHPAPFVFLCFLAGASLLVGGFAIAIGNTKVFLSRAGAIALGATYIGVGLLALLVGMVFYGLMTMCVVCIA
jgi:hypothetical protein